MESFNVHLDYIIEAPTRQSLERRIQSESASGLVSRNATLQGIRIGDDKPRPIAKRRKTRFGKKAVAFVLLFTAGMLWVSRETVRLAGLYTDESMAVGQLRHYTATYTSDKYGYSVCYDPGRFAQDKEKSTQESVFFVSKDGHSAFSITAVSSPQEPMQEVFRDRVQDYQQKLGKPPAQAYAPQSFVIWDSVGPAQFYEKAISTPDGYVMLDYSGERELADTPQFVTTGALLGRCFTTSRRERHSFSNKAHPAM